MLYPKPSRFLLFSDSSCQILPPWRILRFLLSSCCFNPQTNASTSACKFLLESSCWFTMTDIREVLLFFKISEPNYFRQLRQWGKITLKWNLETHRRGKPKLICKRLSIALCTICQSVCDLSVDLVVCLSSDLSVLFVGFFLLPNFLPSCQQGCK